MPKSSRLHLALIDRLRSESPGTFPQYALDELKRVQIALRDPALARELGAALEGEGFTIDEAALWSYIHRCGRQTAFVLAYYNELVGLLWRGSSTETTEEILRFLERNPFVFGSGYHKAELTRALAHRTLKPKQRQRVELILRDVVLGGWEVSMPGWPRLVRLCSREAVEAIAREAMTSPREDVQKKGALALRVQRGKTHDLGTLTHGYGRHRWPTILDWARVQLAASQVADGSSQEPTLPGMT